MRDTPTSTAATIRLPFSSPVRHTSGRLPLAGLGGLRGILLRARCSSGWSSRHSHMMTRCILHMNIIADINTTLVNSSSNTGRRISLLECNSYVKYTCVLTMSSGRRFILHQSRYSGRTNTIQIRQLSQARLCISRICFGTNHSDHHPFPQPTRSSRSSLRQPGKAGSRTKPRDAQKVDDPCNGYASNFSRGSCSGLDRSPGPSTLVLRRRGRRRGTDSAGEPTKNTTR